MASGKNPLVVVLCVLAMLAAGCGGDEDTSGGQADTADCGDSGGGFFSSDRQSAGAVPDPGPTGIVYTDGTDLTEMIRCQGGVVAALTIGGDYQFSDWSSTVCRGMWSDGDFTPGDTPTFQFSAAVHEDSRLRGVSSVEYSIAAYDGPGTYEASLVTVRMGSDLPDDQRRPQVTGSGTLVIDWADWGETAFGTSSDLHLIGSFQGQVSGDLNLTLDVPIFGCGDVD